jgi:zinc protease
MRRAAFLVLLAACGGRSAGKAPISPAPGASAPAASPAAPTDEAPRTDGDVTEARVHGLRVLVKRVPGAELVAAQLFVRGGVRNWGGSDAGIEELAVRAGAAGGTERLDRDGFARRLADLGSTIDASAGDDYSVFAAKSLLSNWDATSELLVDVFRRPALPEDEIEVQRRLLLSRLQHEQQEPDGRLDFLAHASLFKGHPYEHRAVGTLETVAALKRDQLLAHLGKLRETSRLLLVVVGDVDPAHVLDQVQKGFGDLPVGAYAESPLPPLGFDAARVTVTEQKLPTNYIRSAFAGPSWSDPTFATAMVAMQVLGFREFEEVRSKRNLSYAPAAFFVYHTSVPLGVLYVTAVDPKVTMKVMFDEARRLRDEPVPEKELLGNKATLLTEFYAQSETGDGQARLLGEAEIRGGDWRLARTLFDRMRVVTSADVQAFAKKNIARLQTVVLGDPKTVDEASLTSL